MSEYVRKYASEEALRQAEATAVSSSSESSMSDFSEDEAQVKMNNNQHVNSGPQNEQLFICSKNSSGVIKISDMECWDFCVLSPTPN